MRLSRITPLFVECLPETPAEGVLYVSMEHAVASHCCACGCKRETITPFSPTDWGLYFDGRTVTLSPSIGNHNFPCKSHYWIENSTIVWSPAMSDRQIAAVRHKALMRKRNFYKANATAERHADTDPKRGLPLTIADSNAYE
jgi:hypothetical protein